MILKTGKQKKSRKSKVQIQSTIPNFYTLAYLLIF